MAYNEEKEDDNNDLAQKTSSGHVSSHHNITSQVFESRFDLDHNSGQKDKIDNVQDDIDFVS